MRSVEYGRTCSSNWSSQSCTVSVDELRSAHLSDGGQLAGPEPLGQLLSRLADLREVLVEPILAALRVSEVAPLLPADRVLGRDDERVGRERRDEDDAAVGLDGQLKRRVREIRDRRPLPRQSAPGESLRTLVHATSPTLKNLS